MTIYTLGYSGWRVEDVERLVARLNALLVDVRLSPRSRVPAFCGGPLAARFGSRYLCLREWGNVNYKRADAPVKLANWQRGLDRLSEALQREGVEDVILLCACRDVGTCHRAVVAERLAERWGVGVAHLEPPRRPGGGGGAGGQGFRGGQGGAGGERIGENFPRGLELAGFARHSIVRKRGLAMKRRKAVYERDRYRVTIIARPEREHPFQFRIVDRLAGTVERRVIRDLTEATRRARREADARASALEADLNEGRASRFEAVTWETFTADYLADMARRCRARSVKEARITLRMFADYRNPDTLTSVTATDVERFLASRPGASRATQNKYLRTLKAALEWATGKGLLSANPAAGVRPAKVDRKPLRVLVNADDRERLLAALGEAGASWETAARLVLATGLRMGEISHLTWRSVNLAERWLVVQPEPNGGGCLFADWSKMWAPKNHDLGILALDADLAGALTERLARARYDLLALGLDAGQADQLLAFGVSREQSVRVFGQANPEGWSEEFRAAMKAACKAEGLPAVGPHDLRRTCATMLARRGLDPLALKTVMRHSHIQTTEQFYIEIDRETAARRASEMLGASDKTGKKCAKSMPSKDVDTKGPDAQGSIR